MSRHLNEEELIDLAEGTRAEGSEPHLAACERCRLQVADLQATISTACSAEVPEPSPLYWDHLSARIRERRTADESVPTAGSSIWTGWRLVVPVVSLAAILLALAVALRLPQPASEMTGRVAPAPGEPASLAASGADSRDGPAPLEEDASLALIADLAGDLDWDGAVEAGLTTSAAAVERAIADMTPGERLELQRILRLELSRSGRGA